MKKLLIVTRNDGNINKKIWSGTPFSLCKELEKYYDVNIVSINTKYRVTNLIVSLFEMKILQCEPLIDFFDSNAKYTSKKLEEIVKSENYDGALVLGNMAASCMIYSNVNIPIIYFNDAVIGLMKGYYYNLSKRGEKTAERMQKNILDKASKIILTSNWAKEGAVNQYKISEDRIEIVHFGANIDGKIKQKSNKHKGVNILFVGVEWQRKGADIAIKCIQKLNEIDKENEYFLHLVGCDAPYKIQDKHIVLYGFLNRNIASDAKKMEELRLNSDLFILPTKAECAGIVFCEACAYSLPSIAYNTGGVSDYIIDGVNGCLLNLTSNYEEFAMAIYNVIHTPQKLEYMKHKCYEIYVKDLNWEVCGNKVKQVIDSVI